MPNLTTWLSEVKARLAKATPRPWTAIINESMERGGTRTFVCAPSKRFVLVGDVDDVELAASVPDLLTRAVQVMEVAQKLEQAVRNLTKEWPTDSEFRCGYCHSPTNVHLVGCPIVQGLETLASWRRVTEGTDE